MRIGIFGDSYADPEPRTLIDRSQGIMPWMLWLEQLSSQTVETFGKSATNIWYSYRRFCQHYRDFDRIVFVYTDYQRWLNINTQEGLAHIVSEHQLPHVPEQCRDLAESLIKIHPHIYDEALNRFVFQQVFNTVNRAVKAENLEIINVLAFEGIDSAEISIDISSSHGAVLTGLHGVSGLEIIDGSSKIGRYLEHNSDLRFCHLNPYNNQQLADVILEQFEQPSALINLLSLDRWRFDPGELDYLDRYLRDC